MGFFFLILLFLQIPTAQAFESLSYSGRLVNSNGAPVAGPVDLTFDLAYSNNPSTVLCSQDRNGVNLSNGVFHVTLDFPGCSPSLASILSNTPSPDTVGIRVIDRTPTPDKIYSFQAIHSVPFSFISQMSKTLAQMNATEGQILTWDDTSKKWVARDPLSTGNGTVTLISTGPGLTGGPINEVGTISIVTNGVDSDMIKDAAIVDIDISATAEIEQSKIKNLTTDLAAKESLIGGGASTDYLNGTKVWNNFDQSVRNALLLGYTSGFATPLSATDNVMEALGKLEGQIIANDTAFDNAGQWEKDGGLIYYNTGNVGVGTATPSEKLDVIGNIALSGKIRLKDSGSNYVELKSPTSIAGTVTFTLPGALGTNGQVLVTDALGNLSWSTPLTSSADIVDGSIVDADVSGSANIAQSKIANLTTDLAAKEPTLIAGTTAQYLRGDKSWRTLNTDAVVEGTKLYFTEPRVLGTDLAGLSVVAGSVTDADSVLSAIGKLTGNQSNYVLKVGDTMSGNLLMGGNTVTGLSAPLLDSDAATKLYVDTEVNNKAYWTKTVNDLSYSTGNVGVGTSTPTNKLDVVGDVALSGKLRLKSDTVNYIELKAPLSLGSTQTYILPGTNGTSGYALTTNGTGTLSWSAVATTSTSVGGDLSGTIASAEIVSGAVGSAEIADLSIVNADIANTTITYSKLNLIDGDIPQEKVNGLVTALGGKEPTIAAGTTAQYWRGDKSWQTLNTTVVPEGTNLYFLDSRVRGALLSGYAAGSATPLAATDTLLEALAKLEGQIIANKAAFDSTGQWSKNGTSVYYSGGNVGIGTSSPSGPLEVNGDIISTGGATALSLKATSTDDHTYMSFFARSAEPTTRTGYIGYPAIGSTQLNIFNETATGAIALGTNGTEKMRVSTDGNVGIGTTTPTASLNVYNPAGGLIGLFEGNPTGLNQATTVRVLNSNVTAPAGSNSDLASVRADSITSDGDISSASILSLGPNYAGNYGFAGEAVLDASNFSSGLNIVNRSATGHVRFSRNSTEHMRITQGGNVGIGTLTPSWRLDVSGGVAMGGNNLDPVNNPNFTSLQNTGKMLVGWNRIAGRGEVDLISNRGAGNEGGFNFYDYTNTGTLNFLMNISGTGNVGIGTSTPSVKLEVVGGQTKLEQEAWKNLTLENGWTLYGGSFSPAQYYKDSTGRVHLRGLVKDGSLGSTVCLATLPVGYRPDYRLIVAVQSANALGRLDIDSNGCIFAYAGSSTWFSIDNVSFRQAN